MYEHSSVTRRGRASDVRYASKIAKWFNIAPGLICSSLYPYTYKGSFITTYHLPVQKLRDTLKLGRSDKGGEWFDFFKDIYPMYDVQRVGASVNGYHVCSEVIINNKYCLEKFKELHTNELDYSDLMKKRAKGLTSDVQVDVQSLSTFMDNNKLSDVEQRDGHKILKFCAWLQANDNQHDAKYVRIPQHYTQASNSRYFSSGTVTVSNCSSRIREAMLGDCYEVDLEAAVFGYYRQTIAELSAHTYIDPKYIDGYLLNKQSLRELIATDCNISIDDVKRGLTSITFGAKLNNTDYSCMVSLIPNKVKRAKFNAHPIVNGIKNTLNKINDAIKIRDKKLKEHRKQTDPDNWVSKGGRYRVNKHLSHLYTHWETNIMVDLLKFIDKNGETLLWIHDGLYCRNKPNEDEINKFLKTYSKWAKCSIKKIDKYNVIQTPN
jgi:hypothetical protein